MELETILAVVAPDQNNDQVLQRAEKISLRYEANVELVMLCDIRGYTKSLQDETVTIHSDILLKPYQKQMDQYLSRLRNQGIDAQGEVLIEKPSYHHILQHVYKVAADLLIKQTRKHSALANAFITNTDWHLIRESEIPLLLVKENDLGSHISIAAAVDPLHEAKDRLPLDDLILDTAHDLACNLPAELHVIHACQPIPTGMFLEFDDLIGDYDAYREKVRARHQTALDQLLADKVESNTTVHFVEGDPDKMLPEVAAKEGIDILVMGAVSRTGLDRLLIGSTAERVLESLQCDIWIIK